MLKISQLGFERNDNPVFKAINFTLQSNEVLEIVGPNGAGKTTLLRILSGLLQPSQGNIYWDEQLLSLVMPEYLTSMTYCGHQPALKLGLTCMENLHWFATLSEQKSGQVSVYKHLIEQVGLSGYENTFVQMLSAGQRRRLVMARLLLAKTKLWLLDEPLTALDQSGIKLVESIIVEHVNAGGMVVVTSHQKILLDAVKQKHLFLQESLC